MSRGPARFKQSDIAKAIRAARAEGAGGVEIATDGTIRVLLAPPPQAAETATMPIEQPARVVV